MWQLMIVKGYDKPGYCCMLIYECFTMFLLPDKLLLFHAREAEGGRTPSTNAQGTRQREGSHSRPDHKHRQRVGSREGEEGDHRHVKHHLNVRYGGCSERHVFRRTDAVRDKPYVRICHDVPRLRLGVQSAKIVCADATILFRPLRLARRARLTGWVGGIRSVIWRCMAT